MIYPIVKYGDPVLEKPSAPITVFDDELGGPIRFQNVVGKLSETPGEVRHAGPKLGSSNRDILIGELGFTEAELGTVEAQKRRRQA